MNEEYDVLVCGTGLTECILSGLLSQEGKRVLHIDRNSFYGGEGASLNLTSLWKMFRPEQQPPQYLGANREWNVDLIPKFVMSNGNLVKTLLKTRVSRYLEWKSVDGSYVYQMVAPGFFSKGGPTIQKVPANKSEALASDLMGLLEKRRYGNFLAYVANYDPAVPKTHEGLDLNKEPFAALAKKYDLEPNTVDFTGHAVALYTDDSFMTRPAIETVNKIKMTMDSVGRYGESPFIYPIYGLGGIPEGFSRMCAIYGGTFMLNKDIDKFIFDADGKVTGAQSGDETAKVKMVICSPTYMINTGHKDKVKTVGKIIRCICIMDHPIEGTNKAASVQIIIPQRQVNRKSDIYVMMVSGVHQVCKMNYYVAIISASVETANPEKEIQLALDLLGPVKEKFITISDHVVPNSNFSDNIFITNTLDPTSHFESATENVMELYKKITGKDLDLKNLPEDDQE